MYVGTYGMHVHPLRLSFEILRIRLDLKNNLNFSRSNYNEGGAVLFMPTFYQLHFQLLL